MFADYWLLHIHLQIRLGKALCVRWRSARGVRLKRQILSRSRGWVGNISQNLESDEIGNGPRENQYKPTLNMAFLDLGLGRSAGISLVLIFLFPFCVCVSCHR